jgi:hypothetical protein
MPKLIRLFEATSRFAADLNFFQLARENILELHVVRTIYSDEQRPKL